MNKCDVSLSARKTKKKSDQLLLCGFCGSKSLRGTILSIKERSSQRVREPYMNTSIPASKTYFFLNNIRLFDTSKKKV